MPTTKATSREAAEQIITDYQTSGLSRQQYCEKNNIKIGTFHWWMKRHNDSMKRKDNRSLFIQLKKHQPTLSNDTESASDLIIDFPSGTRLKWHGKVLPASLAQLISLLHGTTLP